MAVEPKIEKEVKDRILSEWPAFHERRSRILSKVESGVPMKERDVEDIFQDLAEGPLGYEIEQLGMQQEHADYALIDRGLKLAVVEIKTLGRFRRGEAKQYIEDALKQAARYANRHRAPHIMGFDGELIALGKCEPSDGSINVHLQFCTDDECPPDELFYITHYGIFRYPKTVCYSIPYSNQEDTELFKTHHGASLHHTCFAYVGDVRNKSTWIAPYRNPDGSIDSKRLGHAVNYLLSPGGYRGQKAKASRIPEAATTLVAVTLARAYSEIGRWREPENVFTGEQKPDPQTLLWLYLYQHGLENNV